jgi:translation elongation factor TU
VYAESKTRTVRVFGLQTSPIFSRTNKGTDVHIRGNARGALDNAADPMFNACIAKLLDALDRHFPEPKRNIDRPFLMPIEGVHTIEGRGTVATGKIEQGVITVGQKVEILGLGDVLESVVTSVEAFNAPLAQGEAGQNVGLLLRGIKSADIHRGQVIAAPRTIRPRLKFKSEVYVLSKDEGGRHTPFFGGYKPQFFFRTTNVTGELQMPEGVSMVMPGDNAAVIVSLDKPVALDIGSHFAIREDGKTVGSGWRWSWCRGRWRAWREGWSVRSRFRVFEAARANAAVESPAFPAACPSHFRLLRKYGRRALEAASRLTATELQKASR